MGGALLTLELWESYFNNTSFGSHTKMKTLWKVPIILANPL